MKSLRRLIFEGDSQEACSKVAKSVLQQVLEFVFGQLYQRNVNRSVDHQFVQDTYFKKYKLRIRAVEDLLKELRKKSGGPSIDAYQKLLKAKRIEINGKILRNPTAVLADLEREGTLINCLQPPSLCMIHGDLHFDNILVDDRLPLKMRIKLIDPRGFQRKNYPIGSGDVAYDIGKLLHSAHGHYDFIHAGYLITEVEKYHYLNGNKIKMPPLKFEEWATVPQEGGGSDMIMTSHIKTCPEWARDIFGELAYYIWTWIEQNKHLRNDKTWRLRARFNEAMHFCTMGKFHIQKDIQKALAIQICGIKLMNNFFEDYKKYYKKGVFDFPADVISSDLFD
jgi:thiamine kinase-like enzyme